jgi:alanine racemase
MVVRVAKEAHACGFQTRYPTQLLTRYFMSAQVVHCSTLNDAGLAAWVEISLDALEKNYHRLVDAVGHDRRIIVPVKANGYGHGAVAIADAATKRGAYAVQTASIAEAVAIRESGNAIRIIAYPTNLRDNLSLLLRHDIVPSIVDVSDAKFISDFATRPVSVYLKVDSGLQRLGLPLSEAEVAASKIAVLPNVTIEGIYTHVPFKDLKHAAWAESRIRAFEEFTDNLSRSGIVPPITQARASSHLFAKISDNLTAVCAGHFLYGLSPFNMDQHVEDPTSPVMHAIKARLIQVRPISDNVSQTDEGPYGANLAGVVRTGILPIGKANGLRQPVRGVMATALVAGRPAPILSITLEYTVIDLSGHPKTAVGDIVTLLGNDGEAQLELDEVAKHQNCSPLDFCIGIRGLPVLYNEGLKKLS